MATVDTFSSSSQSWPNPNPNPNPNPDSENPTTDQSPLSGTDQSQTLIPTNTHSTHTQLSLFHVSFNQDNGCFACGINQGFRIYNCDPFREIFRRDFDTGGGIGIVSMLFRCNILALVGGGTHPQYPVNKVMIWDDHQGRCIGELSFRSEVRGVRLRRDRIVVVLENKIFVYNFTDLRLLQQIETFGNPKGLCEVSQGSGEFVMVCLGLRKGQVRVEHYASKRTKFVLAHDSRIACFGLAQDGNVVATASNKGTLVRVFNTHDGTLLHEVRRGLSVKLLNEILLQNIDIKGDLTYWTIGRVMMICLSCRQPLVLFEMVMKVLLYNPTWKSFFEKFWNDGMKDSYVALELQHALGYTFRANWKCPGFISPHSFMYLLDRLLFFASLSSEIIFTTRSSLVGWLTSFDSTCPLNTSLSVSKQKIPDRTVHFIVGIVKKIFYNKGDTVSWIQRSKIDPSYYHPILALRLIMILSLIYLQVSDCSKLLRDLLCGGNNIAYLLPNKFVSDLLSRKKGSCLNLNPEIVAEAFRSIEDPLLIMYSGDVSPKIHAPCSISVDLGKSKEETMSILLSEIDTHCVQDPANNVDCGMMPEATSSNSSPDANLNVSPVDESNAEQQMNSELVKRIVKAMNTTTKGVPLNKYMAKSMKKHLNPFKKVLNHILEDGNFSEEDIKFVRDAYIDMKGFYQLFDISSPNVRHKVSSKHMQRAEDFIQNTMPKFDDIIRRSLMPGEPKVEQMLELESSSSRSTAQVEETGGDMNDGEETLGEVALENQTNGGNTQEAKNKNGKGNKKGKKGKGKME